MIQNQDQDDSTIARRKLEKISQFMDSSIRLPGGYRIGWDGIIGLIPGVGDLVGMGISLYVLFVSMRIGASRATLLRMLANVGVETVIGAIPLVGDLFDLAFKANTRNVRLLNRQLGDPAVSQLQDRQWVLVWLLVIFAFLVAVTGLVVFIVVRLLAWIF